MTTNQSQDSVEVDRMLAKYVDDFNEKNPDTNVPRPGMQVVFQTAPTTPARAYRA
ncbi:hypothetical protein L915_01326 [Phytophthora nicotianae]|uniref:Uncharacterized protein n=4 Tax=Phytophthora nicotianae TaxID=4792 RepID=W2HMR9_PHYNI|nr:hypothetical protein L915_01326 [Phytophthora nicotianae]ETL49164.1 hypothetical protein L916_01302 [Phytophthora nicotianae]ETO84713.1 hypothetical protein F444_01400 [Phytophthora nicotianae P1976]